MVTAGKHDCQFANQCNIDLNLTLHIIAIYRTGIQKGEIMEGLK